jgi:malate dehydrogenase (oxaloacetate-decarboxylating)(NADP+)
MFDAAGLVTHERTDLPAFARVYAQSGPGGAPLLEIVVRIRPTVIIGVSGQPRLFTEPVLRALAAGVTRPVVLALSNPTSRSECTADEAYRYTRGASGSGPFGPVELNGRRLSPPRRTTPTCFPVWDW